MKRNMKGFTLIELLAVIVILAIIALIASPIILNVIEESRAKAVVNSAYGVVDAAKLYYTQDQFSNGVGAATTGDVATLKVSGSGPTAGSWEISENGKVVISAVEIDGYTCGNTDADPKVTCTKA